MMEYRGHSFNRFFTSLLAFLLFLTTLSGTLLFSGTPALAENEEPQIQAISALLIDARRGQVIYAKASDEPIKTPVVNKIMTALIACEKAAADATVTASKEAIGVEGALLDLSVGEKYSVKNMVYSVMLMGANDAVKAVAEFVGGGEAGFVKLMNEYAQKIGMSHTHFTNTIGTLDDNQYTTVSDMALLLRYAINNPEFGKILSTQAKPWYDEDKTILLTNTNNMFWNYESTDGGLRGGFDPKLQTLVTTATRNNMRLICILTDVSEENGYADSVTLFNKGFDNYRYGTLVAAGSIQKTVTVEDETLNLVPTADVHYLYPRGQNFIKNVAINLDQAKLKPPVTKNTVVGTMTFTLMDNTIINVELYPDKEILPKKTRNQIMKERLEESRELLYVIAGLVLLELILLIGKAWTVLRKIMIKKKVRRPKLH